MRMNPNNFSFTGVELGRNHLQFNKVGNQLILNDPSTKQLETKVE